MSFFRNAKIGKKLAMGFSITLLITVIISVIGVSGIAFVHTNYRDTIDYPIERFNVLGNIDLIVMDARRLILVGVLNAGDNVAINDVEGNLNDSRSRLLFEINRFRTLMTNDPTVDDQRRALRLTQINTVEGYILEWLDIHVPQIMASSRAGDIDGAMNIVNSVMANVFINVENNFFELYTELEESVDNTIHDLADFNTTMLITIVIAAIAAIILGVIVSVAIIKSISRPLAEVSQAIKSVSQGNLNTNIRHTTNTDEVGLLAQSTQALVATLQRLIKDMDYMADEHEKGEIDVMMNPASFSGEYSVVVRKINHMVQSTMETQDKAISTFVEIADGNFTADIERLPGKKYKINVAINDMRKRIQSVSNNINKLIQAAADRGDLDIRIEEDNYTGGWRDIMKGLNKLSDAIDRPVVEIRNAMKKLGTGSFDIKIEGDYAGDFLLIKTAFNDTIKFLNDYIKEISGLLSAMAAGDLTRTTQHEYIGDFREIKTSLDNITHTMHRTISEIGSASDQVLGGAKQISTSAMELANGATEQASSVEELTASIDLINQQTRENANNAENASSLASGSTENARSGNEAMKKMLEAMLQIKNASNDISKIIKVIQDIAFQTNLLSLNASVEAARAGEHGKGFSVVADEVRSLAARSQTAATETTTLIESSIERVDVGSSIATTTAEALDVIVGNASEVMRTIKSISSSSRDQAEAIEQISIGLAQISQVVQNNSAVSEETAAASQELNSQAEVLHQLVAYFKL
ncbi:MAG: methyl-accepting chemotaxis protein [Defluviitaleaceae bacterium]|nr:methyl-accepting chemotaxis protein [Defluviitaleaceae bacterium]